MGNDTANNSGRAADSGDMPVVRVFVEALSVRTEATFDELDIARTPEVRFVLVTADWVFDPERGIAVDDGLHVQATSRLAEGREIVVRFDAATSRLASYRLTIMLGDCLFLVSPVLKFGIAAISLVPPSKDAKYVITVEEKSGMIYVAEMHLPVYKIDGPVLITWNLISTNFTFADNGIVIAIPPKLAFKFSSEFQPEFKSDKQFRLLNKNSLTQVFKYDVNLLHNSKGYLINCDPTIKNGTL